MKLIANAVLCVLAIGNCVFSGEDTDPTRVSLLTELLTDKRSEIRGESAEELEEIGPEAKAAVPTLIALLADEAVCDSGLNYIVQVRDTAEDALIAIGSESVPALTEAVARGKPLVSDGAVYALGQIGPKAQTSLPTVIEAINNGADLNLRRRIVRSLAKIDQTGELAIPVMVESLQDEDKYVRRGAAEALGAYGPRAQRAVPSLLKALQDKEPYVRGGAAVSLGDIRASSDHVVAALILLLEDPSGYYYAVSNDMCDWRTVADDAARALGTVGHDAEKVVPPLIETLRKHGPALRTGAVRALGEFGPAAKDAISDLLAAIGNAELSLASRRIAALALAKIACNTQSSVPELKRMLHGQDEGARMGAALVLLSIDADRHKDALQVLSAALEDKELRYFAVRAHTQLGPAAAPAVPQLLAHLEDDEGWSLNWDVAQALGSIGPSAAAAGPKLIKHFRWTDLDHETVTEALLGIGPAAIPDLIETLRSQKCDKKVRIGVANTLGRFGRRAKSAVPALLGLFDDPSHLVRQAAAAALGEIGCQATTVVPALVGRLDDSRCAVRAEAARSLGCFRSKAGSAVEALVSALNDEYVDVRANAAGALKQIGPAARVALPALKEAMKDRNTYVQTVVQTAIQELSE